MDTFSKVNFSEIFDQPSIIQIVGSTNSGKTTLIKHILKNYSDKFSYIFYLTDNKQILKSDGLMNSYIWPNHIFSATTKDSSKLTIFLKELENMMIDINSKNEEEQRPLDNVLVICDDVNKYPSDLYTSVKQSRHYQISLVMLIQYYVDLHTSVREQVSHIILCSKESLDEFMSNKNKKINNNVIKDLYKDKIKFQLENLNIDKKLYYILDVGITPKISYEFIEDIDSLNSCNTLINNKSQLKNIIDKFVLHNLILLNK